MTLPLPRSRIALSTLYLTGSGVTICCISRTTTVRVHTLPSCKKLAETNFEKVPGYGTDPYCASAKAKICAACGCPDADVTFISGGTQTNAIVIASMLQRWQGVMAAATGHVAAHEAGAIEYTGHKVIALPAHEGKVSAADVRDWCATFYADANHDHMVFPGMVYISHPSEYGTLYTKAELEELHAVCQEYHMPLFMDGARLGYGLMAKGTDVTLQDIARLTDVFYIGGTKVGARRGRGVPPRRTGPTFMTMVNQQGRAACQGPSDGPAVRCAVHRRSVHPASAGTPSKPQTV